MGRETTYQTLTEPRRVRTITYTCEGCDRIISPHAIDDTFCNELTIMLNDQQCSEVYLRKRDYCNDCLEPIWQEISKLIKADPDAEGTDRTDEAYYY
jgi:hypothetical protein